MFNKQWLIRKAQWGFSFEELLQNRGILPEAKESYLHPSCASLEDPAQIPGMGEIVERILVATDTDEHITVFGDYDADGITATALLVHFLRYFLQANVDYYIPDRFKEGYGISPEAVETLKEQGTSLIITVDNGIAANQAAHRAKALSVDLIVTDHHQCPPELPECIALLNPHLPESGFQFKDLAGVGVAYTLVRALGICIGLCDEMEMYLPLVALGTVGDCMPLRGQNRILVHGGLARIAEGQWIGLSALLNQSGITPGSKQVISATDLSFRVVPKLNAVGRLGSAGRAVELLLTADPEQAAQASLELVEENQKRQETEGKIYEEAIKAGSLLTHEADACIMAYGKDWHQGVIGIVASRLVEQYGKPAIVLSGDGLDEKGNVRMKGSARSVSGFHLYEALSTCGECLEKFGGHEMAAGLTVTEEHIPALIKALNQYSHSVYEQKWTPPSAVADCVLKPADITVPFIRNLSQLEPFGEGNAQPIFIVTDLTVVKTDNIGGDGKHLRVTFRGESEEGNPVFLDGVAFGKGHYAGVIRTFHACSVLCYLNINSWNGLERPSLRIIDVHDFHISLEKRAQCLYNNAYTTFEGFVLNRNLMKAVYKAVVSFGASWTLEDVEKMRALLCKAGIPCSRYSLLSAISVFTEIGLLRKESGTSYTLMKVEGKLNLSSSSLYRAIASAD